MVSLGIFYLAGAFLGEVAMLALWFKGQPADKGLKDYWNAKRGDIILSWVLALVTATSWAEGTLAKFAIDHAHGYLDSLETTLGVSWIAGFLVALFAHQILKIVGKKAGLEDAKETP